MHISVLIGPLVVGLYDGCLVGGLARREDRFGPAGAIGVIGARIKRARPGTGGQGEFNGLTLHSVIATHERGRQRRRIPTPEFRPTGGQRQARWRRAPVGVHGEATQQLILEIALFHVNIHISEVVDAKLDILGIANLFDQGARYSRRTTVIELYVEADGCVTVVSIRHGQVHGQ